MTLPAFLTAGFAGSILNSVSESFTVPAAPPASVDAGVDSAAPVDAPSVVVPTASRDGERSTASATASGLSPCIKASVVGAPDGGAVGVGLYAAPAGAGSTAQYSTRPASTRSPRAPRVTSMRS